MMKTRTGLCARLVWDCCGGGCQTMSAALSVGQAASGRTPAHTSFPLSRVLQEKSCFPGQLGAGASPCWAVGSQWSDMGMPQQAHIDLAFFMFPADLRIVLANLVTTSSLNRHQVEIYKTHCGGTACLPRSHPLCVPSCSPTCHKSKLYWTEQLCSEEM